MWSTCVRSSSIQERNLSIFPSSTWAWLRKIKACNNSSCWKKSTIEINCRYFCPGCQADKNHDFTSESSEHSALPNGDTGTTEFLKQSFTSHEAAAVTRIPTRGNFVAALTFSCCRVWRGQLWCHLQTMSCRHKAQHHNYTDTATCPLCHLLHHFYLDCLHDLMQWKKMIFRFSG